MKRVRLLLSRKLRDGKRYGCKETMGYRGHIDKERLGRDEDQEEGRIRSE